MGRPPSIQPAAGAETPPTTFPDVPPPPYPDVVNSSWLVECMMQMQASIGELKAHVATLNATSATTSAKLDRISHRIYAAGAVMIVVVSLAGFFLNKIWGGLLILLNSSH